jgi:hypothetical protein
MSWFDNAPKNLIIHVLDKTITIVESRPLDEIKTLICIQTGIPNEQQHITYQDGQEFTGVSGVSKDDISLYVTEKNSDYIYQKHTGLYVSEKDLSEAISTVYRLQKLPDGHRILKDYLCLTYMKNSLFDKEISLFQWLCEKDKINVLEFILPSVTLDKESTTAVLKTAMTKSTMTVFHLIMTFLYTNQDVFSFIDSYELGLIDLEKMMWLIPRASFPDMFNEKSMLQELMYRMIFAKNLYVDKEQDTQDFFTLIATHQPRLLVVPKNESILECITVTACLYVESKTYISKLKSLFFHVLTLDKHIQDETLKKKFQELPYQLNANQETLLFSIPEADWFHTFQSTYKLNPFSLNSDGNTFYMASLAKKVLYPFHLAFYLSTTPTLIVNKHGDTFFHLLFKVSLLPETSFIESNWLGGFDRVYHVINTRNKLGYTPFYYFMYTENQPQSVLLRLLEHPEHLDLSLTFDVKQTIFFTPSVLLFTLLKNVPKVDLTYASDDSTTILIHIFNTFTKPSSSDICKLVLTFMTEQETNPFFKIALDKTDAKGNTPFHYFCMKSPKLVSVLRYPNCNEFNDIINKFISYTKPPYSCKFGFMINNDGKSPGELTKFKLINDFFGTGGIIPRPTLVDTPVDPLHLAKPKPVGNKITFTVMSWNMYNGKCHLKKEINDVLPHVDVIVTQEDAESVLNIPSTSCGRGSERVGLYTTIPHKTECVSTRPSGLGASVERFGYITTLEDKGITVANLHLEGGRFVDKTVITTKDPLFLKRLLDYKMELLGVILDKNPFIIAGDFNSVYSPDLKSQYEYFTNLNEGPLTVKQRVFITEWNKKPYDILLEAGYTYALPKNSSFTSQLGKTVVDAIWYKNLVLYDCYILDLPYKDNTSCISDHNPVIATFTLGTRDVEEKEIMVPVTKNSFTCDKDINLCDEACAERLDNGPVLQAFHATTENIATKIWSSGQFKCGQAGQNGAGIYLCPRPLDCFYKAAFHDVKLIYLFEVDVQMGHSVVVNHEDATTNRPNTPHDSVVHKRNTGIEYVVYRPIQVRIRHVYHVLARHIKSITYSFTQLRSQSFDDMNAYVLGGWTYHRTPIQNMAELGPYTRDTIVDRMSECSVLTQPFCNDKRLVSLKNYSNMSLTGKQKKTRRKKTVLARKTKKRHT